MDSSRAMVTYSTRERTDVEVVTTMMTVKVLTPPSDPSRVVGFGPNADGSYEVHIGDRYKLYVAGEFVHELEVLYTDTEGMHLVELPDGSRHVWTGDGLFAAWIGPRGRGLRFTLRDAVEWPRFGFVFDGDRAGWAVGSAIFESRHVLRVASQ